MCVPFRSKTERDEIHRALYPVDDYHGWPTGDEYWEELSIHLLCIYTT